MPFPTALPWQSPLVRLVFLIFLLQTFNTCICALLYLCLECPFPRYLSARPLFLPCSILGLNITSWWDCNWLQYFKLSAHGPYFVLIYFFHIILLLLPIVSYRLFVCHVYILLQAESGCVSSFAVPTGGRHEVNIWWQWNQWTNNRKIEPHRVLVWCKKQKKQRNKLLSTVSERRFSTWSGGSNL